MSVSKRTRFEVFKRDGFRCRYCGANAMKSLLHVDHVVPRADGGTDVDAVARHPSLNTPNQHGRYFIGVLRNMREELEG